MCERPGRPLPENCPGNQGVGPSDVERKAAARSTEGAPSCQQKSEGVAV